VRNGANGRFILAYDVDQHETRLNSLILFALITAVSLGVVVLLVGYYLAGRLTARLDELALKLDQDAPVSFVTPGLERELLAIARALDESRSRQQAMLERERAFASNLSHEIRTPLTGIRTDAEILLTVPDLPEAVGRRSQRIISGVDRINQLASSLLLLAREAKPAELILIGLVSALESVWCDLQLANLKPVSLGLDISPDVHLQADPVLLDLVLRNVLENSLRYSESGEIVCRLEGDSLVVRDTGPGFAEEDLNRIFDRHFIGQRGVHGIGLAIVQHICNASGWSVRAANAPGGGEIRIDFGVAIREA
jgi:signal transduction histidine kinase